MCVHVLSGKLVELATLLPPVFEPPAPVPVSNKILLSVDSVH